MTDIQRIAEKWAEGYKDPQVSAYEVIKAALEELSALRDTQERERKEGQDTIKNRLRDNVRELHKEITSLRAELARRDEVEKELREELDEAHNVLIETRKCSTEAMGRIRAIVGATDNDPLPAEVYVEQLVASLRSRIGELEAKYGVLKMGFKPG